MNNVLRGVITNPDKIYGKSAYEIAVMHGYDGTEEEWIESVEADRIAASNSASEASNSADIAKQSRDEATEAEEYVRSEAEKWEKLNAALTLEKLRIYGVDGVGRSDATLTRTDDAVGLSYSVGISEITSDFNNCYPWSDICEVVDDHGNVFVKIPKFYSKVTKSGNSTYKYQISGYRHAGFSTLFIDGKGNEIDYVLVGKYEGSCDLSKAQSKSGRSVLTNLTIDDFRTYCKANGIGYQQYDFLIDTIIKHLFTIEFATTNSQSIMKGWTNANNTAALITGKTDSVKTASGSPLSNNTGYFACKYRGIENPWGNICTWCDGISFAAEKIFICTDPTLYEGGCVDAPYSYVGDRWLASGYVTHVTPFEKMPLLGFVTNTNIIESNFYDYYCIRGTEGNVLIVGGYWFADTYAGLWYTEQRYWASNFAGTIGGRLCYKPIQGGVLNG